MAMSSEIIVEAVEVPDVMLSLFCMELSAAEALVGSFEVLLVSVFFLFGEEDATVAFFSSW